MRMYTLSEISNLLTKASRTKVYSMQRIWTWCQEGQLSYEVMPSNISGVSYKAIWISEDELKRFLYEKRFDVDTILDCQH